MFVVRGTARWVDMAYANLRQDLAAVRWVQSAHGAHILGGGHEGGLLHGLLRRLHPVLEAARSAGRATQPRRRGRGACHRQPAETRVIAVLGAHHVLPMEATQSGSAGQVIGDDLALLPP